MLRKWSHRLLTCNNSSLNSQKYSTATTFKQTPSTSTLNKLIQSTTQLLQKLSFSTSSSSSSASSASSASTPTPLSVSTTSTYSMLSGMNPSMMNPAAAAGGIQPMMLGGKQISPMMPQYMQHHAAAGAALPTAGAANTPQIATAVTNASQHPHHASLHHHQLSHHPHQQQYGTLSAAGGMGSSYASYTTTGTAAYPQHYAAQFNRNFYAGKKEQVTHTHTHTRTDWHAK